MNMQNYQEAYDMIKAAFEQEMPNQTPDTEVSEIEMWSEKLIKEAEKLCPQAVKDYYSENIE